MAGFGGMDEEGRRAGGGEGRGDLAADMAGFSEPGDDQAATGIANQVGSGGESRAEIGLERRGEGGDAGGFSLQCAQRRGDRLARAIARWRCREWGRSFGK